MISKTFYVIGVVSITLLLLWVWALVVVFVAQVSIDGFESLMEWARGEFG